MVQAAPQLTPALPHSEDFAELIPASSQGALVSGSTTSSNVSTWILGLSIYNGIFWLYDYVFFSFIIWKFGLFIGALILTFTTAAVDYVSLRAYNSSKEDWLALEYLKSLKFYAGSNRLKALFGWILRSTPSLVQIIVLTPKSNAFITTALLRDGAYTYSSMTRRDWTVFWTSFVFSQMYWIGMVWLGVEGITEAFALLMK